VSSHVIKGARRHPALVRAARHAGRGGGRERIFAEAVRLFGARDFSDVSMQDVADAAGVTKAALYYHFQDKVDLYFRALLSRVDAVREAMEAAVAEGGSLEDRLVRLALVSMERLQSDVYQPHLHSHQHLDDQRHDEVHRAMERLQEPAIRMFAEAGPSNAALSPRAATTLFGGLVASLIIQFPTAADDELPREPAERARVAVRLFLQGYLGLAQ
jgi:AcrR family transcriptional regulator